MLRRLLLLGALVGCLNGFLRGQGSSCGANQYDCAVFFVQHKRFQEAIRTLTDLVRQSPGDLKALNLLGITLTESGQVESANAAFCQALAVNPHFFPARKNLAINEFNRKRYAEAATQFKGVLGDSPDDDVAELYLGEINLLKKSFAAACAYYEKGRAKVSLQPEWILHFGECLLKTKKRDEATAILRKLPVDDAQNRFDAGVLLGKAEAYEPAAELFASARKRYSDPYTAGYNQLLMLIKADKSAEAIQTFQELTNEGYKTAELYNLAAEAYLKSNKVQEAYDAMRAGTQIDPKSEDNYVGLASISLEHEEYSLATDILDVGLHYVPDSYRMHIQRGVSYVMRGAIDEAESDFEAAATLAPNKSLPYLALSWVWIENGKTAKAVEVLRQKWKEPNFDYLVPYAFGVALVRSGAESGSAASDEAIGAFELSVSRNPKFSHSHSELGKLLFKNGDTDRAITELKIATALDPDDAGPLYVLAQAYRKKGQQAEAKQMLARVSQLHSEEHNLDLKKQLIRLVRQDAGQSSQTQGPR